MAISTDSKGQIIPRNGGNGQAPAKSKRPETPLELLKDKGFSAELARALPKHIDADRMLRIAVTALRTTRGLDKCSVESFFASVMQASVLGLFPNTPLGLSYLIPYKNECTLIIGYQGWREIMMRHPRVLSVTATPVYTGDTFKVTLGLHRDLIHVPGDSFGRDDLVKPSDLGILTHTYSVCEIKDASPVFVHLTKEQILRRRNRGAYEATKRMGKTSVWDTDPVPMALKTAVRALSAWAPRSSDDQSMMAHALESASERGLPTHNLLSDEQATALLTAGIEPPEPVEPSAVADAEFTEEPAPPSDSNGDA